MLLKSVRKYFPVFVLVNIAISGTFCVYAAMFYMDIPFRPVLLLLCAGLIGGIYTLNRATDSKEDFCNNSGRAMLFLNRDKLIVIGSTLLAGSFLSLTLMQKLNVYHVVLVLVGITYSLPLIPWRKGFLRLKQVPLAKNLAVAVFWGLSVFLIPSLFEERILFSDAAHISIVISLIIATFTNTVFNDVRDANGDLLAGNNTLPILLGRNRTLLIIAALNVTWIVVSGAFWVGGVIAGSYLAFFIMNSVYPVGYYASLFRRARVHPALEMLSDLCLLVFGLGLIATVSI